MNKLTYSLSRSADAHRLIVELKAAGYERVGQPRGRLGAPILVQFDITEGGEAEADVFVRRHAPAAKPFGRR